jgi:hypothetical protein
MICQEPLHILAGCCSLASSCPDAEHLLLQTLDVSHSPACTQECVDVGGGLSCVDTVFVACMIIRGLVHVFGVSQQLHGQFQTGLHATRSMMPKHG